MTTMEKIESGWIAFAVFCSVVAPLLPAGKLQAFCARIGHFATVKQIAAPKPEEPKS